MGGGNLPPKNAKVIAIHHGVFGQPEKPALPQVSLNLALLLRQFGPVQAWEREQSIMKKTALVAGVVRAFFAAITIMLSVQVRRRSNLENKDELML
jgi:hypothetical protein